MFAMFKLAWRTRGKETAQKTTYYWIYAELLDVTRNDLTLVSGIR